MAIKKYLLIFFFIICIIILTYSSKKVEGFKESYISDSYGSYDFLVDKPAVLYPYSSKKMNITLNNNVLNPLNIIYNNVSVSETYIKNKLKVFFPIKEETIGGDFYKSIQYINDNKGKILIINEDIFVDSSIGLQKFRNNPLKNNRFICSLYYSHFTLITPLDSDILSWKDLENKTIGTIENSQNLINLVEILSVAGYNRYNLKIYTAKDLKSLQEIFINSNVDAIYLTVEHPSNFLKKLSDMRKIRFIFTEGISKDIFKFHFPFSFKGQVNLSDYDMYPSKNLVIDSYAIRTIIITNKDTKKEVIYNFVKNIFENLQYIRKNIAYLKIMIPSFISYCSPLLLYHSGAEKFYNENNYITRSRQQLCYLYTGSFECNTHLVNKNRFIHDFAIEDNYYKQYTIVNKEGKWNNIVNNWQPNTDSGKQFLKTESYNNTPNKPLLVSQINFDTETTRVSKNFVNQIKYSSDQLFPNL